MHVGVIPLLLEEAYPSTFYMFVEITGSHVYGHTRGMSLQRRQLECSHKGEVVASATMIAVTDVGATGLAATIFLILLQEKLRVVDTACYAPLLYAANGKDVVETSPVSLVFISASGTIRTPGVR